jgi:cell fate regulator YaaT (PSP1 superfamily)
MLASPPPPTKTSAIIGVRFHAVGKLYHFDASYCPDVKVGDRVIVETQRGSQMGEVAKYVTESAPPEGGYKRIDRLATPRDLMLQKQWQAKETEAMIAARVRVSEIHLKGLKIVKAEYNYDGGRLSFFYSVDEDDDPHKRSQHGAHSAEGKKFDLKSLPIDMQRLYPDQHIEFRQIGPRDVAKLIGGAGACGLEQRCCSTFLTEFSPVSIKMAKEQGISLDPDEITGMCGRLRCCLVYEYEQYVEARKTLPKRNKRVLTPRGEGKVLDVNPLKQTVYVQLEDGRAEFSKDDLQPLDELQALQTKSGQTCSKHAGGGCNCGKKR